MALILPDYCTRVAVLDFDNFPTDAKEQLSLMRFRMKKAFRSMWKAAAVGYWVQAAVGVKWTWWRRVAPIRWPAGSAVPAGGDESGLRHDFPGYVAACGCETRLIAS
jgi:hypothetical protein